MREKGWEERGPKAHSKNSDFSTPLIFLQVFCAIISGFFASFSRFSV